MASSCQQITVSGDEPLPLPRASILFATERLVARARSTDGVGCRFQIFGINDLEVVTLNFARWNLIRSFLREVKSLRSAA